MELFSIIPEELFSVLASPNRRLYASALDILYMAYGEKLRIEEEHFYSLIRNRLEEDLITANFEEDGIAEEEMENVSGRARFLMRLLLRKGWFLKERGQDFKEFITVPEYSSRLLKVLHDIRNTEPERGFSYVFTTYSTLVVANRDDVYTKMVAVFTADENTRNLISALQRVYHNVHHYFQKQMEMENIEDILVSHFDEFHERVMEAYIRPLKISDSVPKYRTPIQTILQEWAEDENLMRAMAKQAYLDRRGDSVDVCYETLYTKIQWVYHEYNHMEEEYIKAIDEQVAKYTKATTKKLEHMTMENQDIGGKIQQIFNYLLEHPKEECIGVGIGTYGPLHPMAYVDSKSVWYRKRPKKRERGELVEVSENKIDESLLARVQKVMHRPYGKPAVYAYMEGLLKDQDEVTSETIPMETDRDYIMSLLAVVYRTDKSAPYAVDIQNGTVRRGVYGIPNFVFTKRSKR